MMEGKEGKLVEEEEPEFIKVESIHFNNGSDLCGVTEPVNIEIAFTALDPLQVAHWEFKVRYFALVYYLVWFNNETIV